MPAAVTSIARPGNATATSLEDVAALAKPRHANEVGRPISARVCAPTGCVESAGLPMREHLFGRALQGGEDHQCVSRRERPAGAAYKGDLSAAHPRVASIGPPSTASSADGPLSVSSGFLPMSPGMSRWPLDEARRRRRRRWLPRQCRATTLPPQGSTNGKNAACSGLYDRVNMLDSMGRAGSQYYDLDWVRRERKEARDQQHRLRC